MGIRKLLDFFRPPRYWKMYVWGIASILTGVGAFLFYVSRAHSYLSDDPETCINCHLMAPQYATWQHSAHREVAVCNDCHVPHDNVFNKYFFKAQDGLRHATIFTLRAEPQVIRIKEAGVGVVQANCIRCHSTTNERVGTTVSYDNTLHGDGRLCWDCHREVPHGRVKSLSSTPHARVPLPGSPVPDWLRKLEKENVNLDKPNN